MSAKTSIKWGISLGIGLVAGTQILTWLGLGVSNWFVVITLLFAVVFVALGLREIKRRNDGVLTMVGATLAVLMIILISRYVFQLYMFVYINYIDPNWVNQVAETWTTSMREADTPTALINQRIDAFRQGWQTLPMFTVQIIFGAVPQIVLGLITSLFFVFKKTGRKMVEPEG